MNTNETDLANNRKLWSRRKKIMLVSILGLLLFVGFLIAWLLPNRAPDPAKMTRDEAVKYFASKKFANLPDQEKFAYMKKMRDKVGRTPPHVLGRKLNDNEKKMAMNNMQQMIYKMIKNRLKRFYTLSKEEQDAELDKLINMMEAGKKHGNRPPGSPPGGGGKPGRKDGPPNPGAVAKMVLENTDSSTRAQAVGVVRRLQQRMKERGVEGPELPFP